MRNKYYLTPETYIQLTADLADFMLEYSSLDPVTETDENGDERYTDEKQDEFCAILDQVESLFSAAGIFKE